MKRTILTICAIVAATFAVEAQKAPKPTLLSVDTEQIAALQALDPSLCTLSVGDKVKVNDIVCTVLSNKKGGLCVEVPKSDDGVYKGGYPADICFLEGKHSPNHMRLVPAQLYKEGSFDRLYMPLRAEQAVDGKLTFKPLCGVLKLTVSGDAALNCIKLEDNSGRYMTGYFDLDAEAGVLRQRKATAAGVYCTVIECSNNGQGVQLDKAGKAFYVVLPVGNYEKGLKVSFTDRKHHTMSCDTKPFEIKRGEITAVAPIAYTYPADQLFAENFDNMVFGGDRMRGKNFKGLNPISSNGVIDGSANGTERATHISDYKSAGSDYMQENWKLTPLEEQQMSADYLRNRNLSEYGSLLRAQEHLGYLGIGVKDHGRGTFTTPAFSEIKEISDIEISFKISPEVRHTTDYNVNILNAGVVKEYWIDGILHTLTSSNYPFVNSRTERIVLKASTLSVGRSFNEEDDKPWYNVRFVVSGATNKTALSIIANDMGDKERNGFFIDEIEVKNLRTYSREKILRIMDYNVQNGIWSAQHDNYNGFVEFMKEQDIDIAIFCEASTIYYDHTNKGSKFEERYLPYKYQPYEKKKTDHLVPTGWIELAARYGHNYVAIGAHQDNYPVVVTSKYPIVKSVKLGGDKVSHGGIHAQVDVEGEIVNIVGFHTWPQGWEMGIKGKDARAKSTAEHGGHKTRYDETKHFMERTILNPEYANEKHWIITGDMNCVSPLDDATLDLGWENPRYAGQRFIVEQVPQVKDLIKLYNSPDKRDVIISSTMGTGRIDLMYGSEKFAKTLIKAKSPRDGWTNGKYDKESGFFKECGSDHLPVLCDFLWR
jgi:exonuclease III